MQCTGWVDELAGARGRETDFASCLTLNLFVTACQKVRVYTVKDYSES